MRVIALTDETRLTGCYAATIGFFDGVHLGHCYVLEQLHRLAQEKDMPSMAITFDRHPRQVVDTQWHPLLLTTLEEKIELLQQTGIDVLVVLPFDEKMASLSARDFMLQVLKERLGVRLLLTGYDNRFGHRTADSHENFHDYVRYGNEMGIDVVCGEGLQTSRLQDDKTRRQQDNRTYVSSSLIRRLLSEGRVGEAAQCLGRPYSLSGTVVHGFEQGRKMGFPTANIQTDACRLVPADGVYAVHVKSQISNLKSPLGSAAWLVQEISNLKSQISNLIGLTNIGMRPTFDGHRRTIETHILDFEGDLYGQHITIDFVERLRDEQHFESPEELTQQMMRDAETAKRILLDE